VEVDGVFACDNVLEGRACLALREDEGVERRELGTPSPKQYLRVFLGALEGENTNLSATQWRMCLIRTTISAEE
jgi:hypothetical protein